MELFQNALAYFGQDHGLPGQLGGWIIAVFAVALTLSAFIPRRAAEPDWQADVAPWPMQAAHPSGAGGAGGDSNDPAGVQLSHRKGDI